MNGGKAMFAAMLVGSAAALGQPTGDAALRAGNERYRAGEYERALEAYGSAADSDPLTLFNQACALQRLGRTDEAESLLQRVDAMTRRDDLAAGARYNLGAAAVEQARAMASEGLGAEALDAYRRGARLFRDAYAMNPKDTDAARNIEIAGREAKALLDQIRAQQQAVQQMADRLNELQQQQENEAQENESAAGAQEQPSDPSQQQEQQQLSEQTQAARDQLRELQRQMDQSQQGSTATEQDRPLEQAAERVGEAIQRQQEAMEQLEQGDPQGAAESQREAAERLREALREMTGEQAEGQEGSPQEQQDGEAESGESDQNSASDSEQDPQESESENEASEDQQQGEGQAGEASDSNGGAGEAGDANADPLEALAENLLEKEKDDRERLQRMRAQRRAGSAPVEKDW